MHCTRSNLVQPTAQLAEDSLIVLVGQMVTYSALAHQQADRLRPIRLDAHVPPAAVEAIRAEAAAVVWEEAAKLLQLCLLKHQEVRQ